MEIRGKDYTIAIVIMMMGQELDDTMLTMASLLRSIHGLTGISISLLLNGSNDAKIKQQFEKIPNLTFYVSPINLGVAGGRNFLFTRPEVIGADIIMTLDNDLFLPTDYVRGMAEFLVNRPDAGLVGPVMLWTYFFHDFIPPRSRILTSDISRIPVRTFSSEELKQDWIKRGDGETLYYLGTHNWVLTNCLASPTSIQNLLIRLKRKKIIPWAPHLLLHADPEVVRSLKGGTRELQTQTINGGASVFFSSLLDSAGLLEPAYSPYGHEDHEFAVRVLRDGYRNYANPDTFVLHGSDTRQPARDYGWRKFQYARRRAITTRKTIRCRLGQWLIIVEIFIHTLITAFFSNLLSGDVTFPSVRQGIAGWFQGATARLTDNVALMDRVRLARASAASGKSSPLDQ